MSSAQFEVSEVIPATPDRVYATWLSSDGHSAMTGGKAEVNAVVGQPFTAWDGYIEGKNVALEPNRRIVQTWRTTEFPSASPDSKVEVLLEPVGAGTRVTIRHSDLPEDQGPDYESGWLVHYFSPMKSYFANAEAVEVEDTDISETRTTSEWLEDSALPVAPPLVKRAAKAVVKQAKAAVKQAKAAVKNGAKGVTRRAASAMNKAAGAAKTVASVSRAGSSLRKGAAAKKGAAKKSAAKKTASSKAKGVKAGARKQAAAGNARRAAADAKKKTAMKVSGRAGSRARGKTKGARK